MIRIGSGYDVHRFASGRKLFLGGEQIGHPLGLLGHSDADVLLHALCDALLGAVAKGDIGVHFPPSDEKYKDIASMVLLERVIAMLRADGWRLVNADMTVVCELPKIAPYAEKIRKNIAAATGVAVDAISLKATTSEGLGFTGREEGIAAMAVVLVEQ
jgi:2-C-methyl-D-erythritol 2,4-cyclodiphosphate synthase